MREPTAHVEVYSSGRLLATKVVAAQGIYRFVLRRGNYVVSNAGPQTGTHQVVVHAARTTHQDLPNYCM